MKTLRGLKVLSLSVSLGLFLAACSTTGGNPQANDPYEQTNRQVFDLDIRLDRHILLPTAQAYNEVVPEFARDGVHNFLLNLNSPVIFANDVLQGEASRGGETLARFVLNSTIGIGGLIDVAGKMGIPYHDEDFGQTLGVWGADEGPYLVLPFFGPSNPRDLTGNVVDIAFDPNTYISYNYKFYWSLGRGVLSVIDLRARNATTLAGIERGSVDYYASVRSLYRQNRANEIANGKQDVNNLPDF
jgi:phospholipid-binding lipoprotein MlaA